MADLPEAQSMSPEEVRDELATLAGWYYHKWGNGGGAWSKKKKLSRGFNSSEYQSKHPIEDSLDAAHASFPEGWTWIRGGGYWIAHPSQVSAARPFVEMEVPDTGIPKHDLFRLALLCQRKVRT